MKVVFQAVQVATRGAKAQLSKDVGASFAVLARAAAIAFPLVSRGSDTTDTSTRSSLICLFVTIPQSLPRDNRCLIIHVTTVWIQQRQLT